MTRARRIRLAALAGGVVVACGIAGVAVVTRGLRPPGAAGFAAERAEELPEAPADGPPCAPWAPLIDLPGVAVGALPRDTLDAVPPLAGEPAGLSASAPRRWNRAVPARQIWLARSASGGRAVCLGHATRRADSAWAAEALVRGVNMELRSGRPDGLWPTDSAARAAIIAAWGR